MSSSLSGITADTRVVASQKQRSDGQVILLDIGGVTFLGGGGGGFQLNVTMTFWKKLFGDAPLTAVHMTVTTSLGS